MVSIFLAIFILFLLEVNWFLKFDISHVPHLPRDTLGSKTQVNWEFWLINLENGFMIVNSYH